MPESYLHEKINSLVACKVINHMAVQELCLLCWHLVITIKMVMMMTIKMMMTMMTGKNEDDHDKVITMTVKMTVMTLETRMMSLKTTMILSLIVMTIKMKTPIMTQMKMMTMMSVKIRMMI